MLIITVLIISFVVCFILGYRWASRRKQKNVELCLRNKYPILFNIASYKHKEYNKLLFIPLNYIFTYDRSWQEWTCSDLTLINACFPIKQEKYIFQIFLNYVLQNCNQHVHQHILDRNEIEYKKIQEKMMNLKPTYKENVDV